jgi:poly-gamma-glutamate synthesis protein (capsule biosynthesis protein)
MGAQAGPASARRPNPDAVRVFLCGDIMIGRGIDQVLAMPCEPELRESNVRSANEYVRLAELTNGPIKRPVSSSYIWGAALEELNDARPDVRIINLETAITRSTDFAEKGINYRVSPENAECLAAAAIDCCVLANNHVLDFGRDGLIDTLSILDHLGIKTAGAGRNSAEASVPAVLDIAGKARVLIWSFASTSSGVPSSWKAMQHRPGVNLLRDTSQGTIQEICGEIARIRRPNDIVIVSVHWGPNWGYEIPEEHTRFAHALIERANVSIIHGHSSHHAKAVEIYRDRAIFYGCGDFLNDYEGIGGYESHRSDLALMFLVDVNPLGGNVTALEVVPFQIRRLQLARASADDVEWVRQMLNRETGRYSTRLSTTSDGRLRASMIGAQSEQRGP